MSGGHSGSSRRRLVSDVTLWEDARGRRNLGDTWRNDGDENGVTGYNATPGWDLTTGWGSPNLTQVFGGFGSLVRSNHSIRALMARARR